MFDVVGMDYPCMDLNVNVNTLPKSNEGTRINNLSWQGGGKVSSGLVTAARLGAACSIFGTVGDDRYGRFCRCDFEKHGIDTKYLFSRPGTSTHLSIVLSDKETMGRSIVYYPGTCGELMDNEIPEEALLQTKYFFMAKIDDVSKKAANIARSGGAKVFIDGDSYSKELVNYIPYTDIFVASEFVYRGMFDNDHYEENCSNIMALGPEIVVFTFGEKGAVGISAEGFFSIPAYDVNVVDTVGAGDDFHGAFLAGLLKPGWSVKFITQFASAVSAIKCTRIGGRAGIPDMETTLRFMETGRIDYTEINRRVEYYKRGIDYV